MRCTNYTGSPLGTGGKLNLRKTFRRHPKRLLNILRTIILHPVPGGEYYNDLAYETCSELFCNLFMQPIRVKYYDLFKYY